MRSRMLPALVAGALAVTMLGQGAASADPREVTGPSLPATASSTAAERASDALARAQALFAEKSPASARRQLASGRDATMVLNELMRVYDDLSAEEKTAANRLFARPTDGVDDPEGDGYTVDEEAPFCGDTVCIHYVATSPDRPVMTDTDVPADGIPDSVEQALATAEHVNDTYVAAGYRRPDPDGDLGSELGGGSDLVDIYLANIGGQGLYGYCTSDQPLTQYNLWAYCVIDDDFAEFPANTPEENQQVTLAHEYFHAVQFAYDAFEDGWIIEATATWAEEQLYDGVNDNRQYLPDGQLRLPWLPLDEYGDGNYYGNWIFFEYLTQRWPDPGATGTMPRLVLDLWKRMNGREGAPDQYSTQALQYVLGNKGTTFTQVYGQFADANRRPAKTYDEGGASAYRPAAPFRRWTLSASKRSTGGRSTTVDHLASAPFRFTPASGLTRRDWKIRIKVDMPPAKTAPVARVAVYLKSGKVNASSIKLKPTGASRKVLGFSSRNVRYVELVLVNASRRSRCWVGDLTYACQGDPIDDRKRTVYSASIFRS